MMWMAECKKTIFINHKYTPGKTTWHMVSNKVFLRIITKVTEIFNKLMRVSLQIALIGGLIITIIADDSALSLNYHIGWEVSVSWWWTPARMTTSLDFIQDWTESLSNFPSSQMSFTSEKLLEKMGPPNRSLVWHSKVFQVTSPYISFLLTSHFSVFWWWLDSWSWGLEALHSIIIIVSSVCLSGLSDWSWRWARISCWTWGFGLESCRLSENYAVAL